LDCTATSACAIRSSGCACTGGSAPSPPSQCCGPFWRAKAWPAAPTRAEPCWVDDSAVNLKSARAAGFATVLRIRPVARRALAGGAYVDARVRTVRQLARRLG